MQNAFNGLSRRYKVGPHAALSVLIIRRMLQIAVTLSNFCLFLEAFAKLQRASVIFVMCVCLSVRPHGITRLPLDWYSWNLIFEYFSESVKKIKVLLKSWQELQVLAAKTSIPLWSHLVQFVVEWEMFQTKVVEEGKIHFIFHNCLQKIAPFKRFCWKNMVEPERSQMTM
jgi:hypothetical protein